MKAADFRCWHKADVPEVSPDVRFQDAGSTGRRNTGVKSLCWGFKLQGLTWSFVELTSHVLTAIGQNLRRVLAWLKALLHSILLALCWAFASRQHSNRPS